MTDEAGGGERAVSTTLPTPDLIFYNYYNLTVQLSCTEFPLICFSFVLFMVGAVDVRVRVSASRHGV